MYMGGANSFSMKTRTTFLQCPWDRRYSASSSSVAKKPFYGFQAHVLTLRHAAVKPNVAPSGGTLAEHRA
jgi:hypothetical protein